MTSTTPDVASLRRRLDRLRKSPEVGAEVLLQDLETAYEELRTSEEEVRVQREELAALAADHSTLRRQHDRLLATLPAPVVVTDRHGTVRSANAAAAALLRLEGRRLVGKPLLAFAPVEDRGHLRTLLARASAGEPTRLVTAFRSRERAVLTVEALAFPTSATGDEVTWVLLTTTPDGGVAAPGRVSLPDALSRLAVLPASLARLEGDHPRQADRRHQMLAAMRSAAEIVRDALGVDAHVTIALGPPAEPESVVSTSGTAQRLDGAQVVAGEGPAAAAYEGGVAMVCEDLASDARWPQLARALAEPVGAAVAVPLEVDTGLRGVLCAYRPACGPGTVEIVTVLAGPVAGVLQEVAARQHLADLADQLQQAMRSRAVIEQAKGMIMAADGCDADVAFARLVTLSSHRQTKLRDVAALVVAHGGDLDAVADA